MTILWTVVKFYALAMALAFVFALAVGVVRPDFYTMMIGGLFAWPISAAVCGYDLWRKK